MLASLLSARQMNPGSARRVSAYYVGAFLLSAMSILLVVDISVISYFTIIFFGDTAVGPCLMVCFCVILLFAGIALFERDIFILTVFAAIIAFFLFYYLYFIFGANRPLNFNALGSYYSVLAVVVFYVLAKRNLLPAAMKILFYVYTAYLMAYPIIVFLYAVGAIDIESKKTFVVLVDQERGARLFLYEGAAAYVAMYSMSKLQEKFRSSYLVVFGLASFAAYLSMSRVFILCSVFVLALYAATRRLKLVQRVCFLAYLLVALYLVIGIFDPSFNPYSFSDTDTSTLARRNEYEILVPYIRNFPFLGIGLPDATPGLTQYLGAVAYPSDVGIIGVWFMYGLVGVLVIGVLIVYISCIQNLDRSSSVLGAANARTLSLTGCIIGLYEITSHDLYGRSALIFSLIFANTLYNARLFAAMRRQPSPTLRTPIVDLDRSRPARNR